MASSMRLQENNMKTKYKSKTMRLENKFNGEEFFCDDTNRVDRIDGVEFIFVYKYGTTRLLKIRKDSLQPVKTS